MSNSRIIFDENGNITTICGEADIELSRFLIESRLRKEEINIEGRNLKINEEMLKEERKRTLDNKIVNYILVAVSVISMVVSIVS